jgi:hypothetical protein
LIIREVILKKTKNTTAADQLPTIRKQTKTKKNLKKEIIQFLDEVSTKEGKSTKPG